MKCVCVCVCARARASVFERLHYRAQTLHCLLADAIGQQCITYDRSEEACAEAAKYSVNGSSAAQMCCGCGGGFANTAIGNIYSSTTGFLQITFTSDDVSSSFSRNSGFRARWDMADNGGLEVITLQPRGTLPTILRSSVVPICTPLCRTADLVLTTLPFRNGDAHFNFSLGKGDEFTRQLKIKVLAVNDAPTFALVKHTLLIQEFTSSSDAMVVLAVNVSKGPQLRSEVSNENYQKLTARLDLLNLGLTSTTSEGLGAGMCEGGPAAEQPNGCFIFLNMTHVSGKPDRGELYFRPPLFFSGWLEFNLTLRDNGDTGNGSACISSQEGFIDVSPVNQIPSFTLVNSTWQVDEAGDSHAGSRPAIVMLELASNIEKGPPRPYTGEDEEEQSLSFKLTPHNHSLANDVIDLVGSSVNSTGWLLLRLQPYQYGDITFDLRLEDSGGASSDPYVFTICVQVEFNIFA